MYFGCWPGDTCPALDTPKLPLDFLYPSAYSVSVQMSQRINERFGSGNGIRCALNAHDLNCSAMFYHSFRFSSSASSLFYVPVFAQNGLTLFIIYLGGAVNGALIQCRTLYALSLEGHRVPLVISSVAFRRVGRLHLFGYTPHSHSISLKSRRNSKNVRAVHRLNGRRNHRRASPYFHH